MNRPYEWKSAPVAEFAVIGDPISHSLSPRMHLAAYRALNLNYEYVAIRVDQGEVELALKHLKELGYRGVNVTVPHKPEAFRVVASTDETSRRIGASNTIDLSSMNGINTDVSGFAETLMERTDIRRALVFGAGGSARAVVLALYELGIDITIFNRTLSRAINLLSDLGIKASIADKPALSRFDLVVNATSASLDGKTIQLDWAGASENTIAYDLSYSESGLTPFLLEAKVRGLKFMDGKPLLVAQGARSFEYWLGISAPRNVMMESIQ